MDLTLREITSDQSNFYTAFFTLGLIEDEENFRLTPDDALNGPFPTKGGKDSFTLGVYADSQLAGVISFTRDGANREKLKHKGILFRLYVGKDFRGKGIAKKLIQAVIIRAKNIGDIDQINLTVISSNLNAKLLYEKFGFKTFSSEYNSIKWKNKYFNEDQMALLIK